MTLYPRALKAIASCLVAATGALPFSAMAQASQPIKLVVPTSPGSSADIGARAVGDVVARVLGRQVVTENKVGAGGSLSATAVAAAEPNGDTVGVLGNTYLLFHLEYPQMKFNPLQDVTPVAMISRGTNVLLVAANSPYTKLADVVQKARAEPGRVSYASAGLGSSTYHSAERLRNAASLDLIHVPYKGSPESINEVIGGRVDFAFAPVAVAATYLQGGKVRAIAVSAAKRSTLLPQVPTTVEAGVPGSSQDSWLVALVPAKTPAAKQAELNKAFNTAATDPEVRQRFTGMGIEPESMSLEEVRAFVRREYDAAIAIATAKPKGQ